MSGTEREKGLAVMLYGRGLTLAEVGSKLGRSTAWVRLTLIELKVPRRKRGSGRKPLRRTVMAYREALVLRDQSWTLAEIGKKFGVSRQRVHQILTSPPE